MRENDETLVDGEEPIEADPAGESSIGPYADAEAIGAGGMGVVVAARDPKFGRRVAVKILRPQASRDPYAARKFIEEARVTGELEHPGIVPVHDLGRAPDGRPYFAMKLVKGKSLDRVICELRDVAEPRTLVTLRGRLLADFLKVCDAVAFAHSRGVIHRDIKPANIMVGEFGEVLVMDWGLARVGGRRRGVGGEEQHEQQQEGGAGVTAVGKVVGTPAYMPPEQADGNHDAIDERSDVYALGAVLYEILTLSPPYRGKSGPDVLARVLAGDLERPSRRAPDANVPRELELAVLKAMAREPSRRYRTAAELRDDVEAFLAGRTLAAVRYSWPERAAKWIARHRAVSAVSAAALLALAALGTASFAKLSAEHRETREARDLAEERLDETVAAREAEAEEKAEVERLLDEAVRSREALLDLEKARPLLERARRCLYREEATFEDVANYVGEARTWIDDAVARAPELALAHDLAGRAWELLGWTDRAEACWRKATELDPDLETAHYFLGRSLAARAWVLYVRSTGMPGSEEIRTELERLTVLAIRTLERARDVGAGYHNAVQQALATAMLAVLSGASIELTAQIPEDLLWYGGGEEAYLLQGLLSAGEERLAAFDAALRVRPKYPLVRFLRGVFRQQRGDLDGAAADYDEAIRFAPRLAAALFQRAGLRLAGGDPRGAIANLDLALECDPGYFEAHVTRGDARRAMGDLPRALCDYDEAIRLAPRFPEAYANRGLLREESDPEGAIGDLQKALEVAPGDWPHRAAVEGWIAELRRPR